MPFSLLLAAAALQGCKPLPGAAQLWENHQTRFVVVGEMHGTVQTPDVFFGLVCSAQSSHRPLVVALEQAEIAQPAINAFIATTPLNEAERAFCKSLIWTGDSQDGRSSAAYLNLFVRLRASERSGLIQSIVAFQPVLLGEKPVSDSDFNKMMAKRLEVAAETYQDALVLVLVGNVHARKLPLRIRSTRIDPAVSFLPPKQVVSLNVPVRGKAWNCEDTCGPHNEDGDVRPGYGVYIGAFNAAFDGEIRLGETRHSVSTPDRNSFRQRRLTTLSGLSEGLLVGG